jgi:3-oxoacyl-[acyl-carrier-protein] synthase III
MALAATPTKLGSPLTKPYFFPLNSHKMYVARLTGLGHYVPERVVTNQDLASLMDTSEAWIVERTGIHERRFFDPEKDSVSIMGAHAARLAIERAGIKVTDIDLIVFATITPDYYFPGSGVLLGRELGLEGVPAFDIRAQCTGFVYGLSIADQFIRSGMCRSVLVVGSEIQSSVMDISTEGRAVSVIFGDGAGAVIVQRSSSPGILSTHLHADGRFAEELAILDPGSGRPGRSDGSYVNNKGAKPYMNGNLVFRHATQRMPEVIMECLAANDMVVADIDLLVPHQANARITAYIAQTLGIDVDKVISNIERYGNTTAASIPIALSEAWEAGRLNAGTLLCLAAFGSGFTWGSALIRM